MDNFLNTDTNPTDVSSSSGGWITALQGLGNTAAGIIGALNPRAAANNPTATGRVATPANYTQWIVVGVIGLAAILLLVMFTRR